MGLFEAIILGVIQGLTEFLPISSSGHLVLWQQIFGMQKPGLTLEVILHVGTLGSIFWVFSSDFIQLIHFYKNPLQKRFILLLIIGTIPTGIIGWFIGNHFVGFIKSPLLVGVMLLLTGGLVYFINRASPGGKTINDMSFWDAVWIGLLQGVAVIPGVSRSGSTVAAALSRNLDRQTSIKYSFMLAAPAILGATLFELYELFQSGVQLDELNIYLAGGLVAFVFGIVAIKFFINLFYRSKFIYFVYYCWVVGISTIILNLIN